MEKKAISLEMLGKRMDLCKENRMMFSCPLELELTELIELQGYIFSYFEIKILIYFSNVEMPIINHLKLFLLQCYL